MDGPGAQKPPQRGGGDRGRVLPLKSPAMSSIPAVGVQANPQHGFVARPGGAFKFRPLPAVPHSGEAPRNPFQGLRMLMLKSAPPAASDRRATSSHAGTRSSASGHRASEPNVRLDGLGMRRSSTPGVSSRTPASFTRRPLAEDEAGLQALKELHKSLEGAEVGFEPAPDAVDSNKETVMSTSHWVRDSDADLEGPLVRSIDLPSPASRPGGSIHYKARQERERGAARPSTSLGFSSIGEETRDMGLDGPTAYDEILPSSIGRRSASRTPQLMWLHKISGEGTAKRMRQLPPGALSSERINDEASRVFGELAEEAVVKGMSGVSKFVEARALDLRLQNALSQGELILSRPPLTEARQNYYSYIIPELFAVLDLVVDAVGPLGKVLKDLRGQLYNLIFSSERDFSQSVGSEGVAMPLVQQVSELKRGHDRLLAASATQTLLIKKADKEKEERLEEHRLLSFRVHQLEKELKDNESSKAALQVIARVMTKFYQTE
jgi:hypothetical protein